METPSVPTAAELMFAANEANSILAAREAATYVVGHRATITSTALLASADRILASDEYRGFAGRRADFVRNARRLLRRDYNNPVLLTDVALALTASDKGKAAERFIRAAVALAPNNRFVLRSAVRYFLHRGEKEVAHSLLLRSDLLARDPWIQASEIAVATVLGRSSKLIKRVDRDLADYQALPQRLSELGSAVATVHLNAGDEKKAKRMFARTLAAPNDNVVAQAEWASRRINLVVTEKALQVPFSFEANSWHSYRNLEIEKSIEEAHRWEEDEPFASRPVGWLAHLYAINDEFDKAAEYHQRVLELEPNHDIADLLNQNFSRIETGATAEATRQLLQLSSLPDAATHRPQIIANAGALAYATGQLELGRTLYLEAANAARHLRDPRTEMLVRAFAARAAIKYGDPQASRIVEETAKEANLRLSPSATHVMRRLVDEQNRASLERSARKRVSKERLVWDPAGNILKLLGN